MYAVCLFYIINVKRTAIFWLVSGRIAAGKLHVINGELWMFFASGTTGEWNSVQCRMMKCIGNCMNRTDWERSVRDLKEDGNYLCETGISLNMTYFERNGEHYLVWAQRDVIVFHTKSSEKSLRHMTARTVHWAAGGTPILFMTGERELKKEYRNVTASIEVKETEENSRAYLFAYFTGNVPEEERLFYGVSRNGFDFRSLNNGNPVHASSLGTGCIRDPFIFKGEDGFYYILATDMKSSLGWSGNHAIIIFRTKDFVTILDSTRIDYRNFQATSDCNRAWAPQAVWCPEKNAYMVYLAIRKQDDELGTVMWRHYTKDLMEPASYMEPELMMKAPNGVDGAIDGDIIYDHINARYIMYYDGKRIAAASSLSGEFSCIDPNTGSEYERVPMYTAEGVDMGVEGSNIYKIIGKDQWIIAADGTPFNGGRYALAETTDFIHYRQLNEEEYSFDFTPRHGYVIPITESQLRKLFHAYGEVELTERIEVM